MNQREKTEPIAPEGVKLRKLSIAVFAPEGDNTIEIPAYLADEDLARYHHATGRRCERCGVTHDRKGNMLCPECRDKDRAAAYWRMPEEEWDGKAMIYDLASDRYFRDLEELEYHYDDLGAPVSDARPIICAPLRWEGNADSILDSCGVADMLPDESEGTWELSQRIWDAAEALSKALADDGPLSWIEGKTRLKWDSGHAADNDAPSGEKG
jgi:hypothetical protein